MEGEGEEGDGEGGDVTHPESATGKEGTARDAL